MTHQLAQKLSCDFETQRIPSSIKEAGELRVSTPFVLISPTYENTGAHGRGTTYTPKQVQEFLKHNSHLMRGIIACGNRNYLDEYGRAGEEVSQQFDVPLLCKVEYAGTEEDVQLLKKGLRLFWQSL